MAKRGINLIIFEENKSGGKAFSKPTGYSILVDEEVFNYMVQNGQSITLVDARAPGLFFTGKAFADDDKHKSGGSSNQSKY